MRIGYFGGSFDPIHFGHLALAEACREGANLDRIVFLVAGAPPHKRERRLAPGVHRLAMARLACQQNPAFSVDARELRREGVTYTIDTMRSLVAEHAARAQVVWLIGGDSLPELTTWRSAEALVDLVEIVTATRPGYDSGEALAALRPVFGEERTARLSRGIVEMPLLDISSTVLRLRVRGNLGRR